MKSHRHVSIITAPVVSNFTMDGNCQSIAIPMCQQMPVKILKVQDKSKSTQINWHFEVQRNSNAKLIGNEISRRSVDFTGTVPLLTRHQLFPLFGRSWINRLFRSLSTNFCFLDILSVRYLHTDLHFGASVLLGRHPALSSSVWTSQIQLWTPRQEVSFE